MPKPVNCRLRLQTGAVLPLAAVAALAAGGFLPALAKVRSFEVVHSFAGGKHDGAQPFANLITDKTGYLYGTTQDGGHDAEHCSGVGCGTVFKIAPDGAETVIYDFIGLRGKDGAYPVSGLLEDSAGNLYGTTGGGGARDCGTVFKVVPDGAESTLYSFTCKKAGDYPQYNLITDSKGNLYSTTNWGGDIQSCGGTGCGVVFKLAPDGAETVLHTFIGGNDGAMPLSGLLRIADNFYGTTQEGGGGACTGLTSGCGVVYELESGKEPRRAEKVLYAFTGGNDGSDPVGNLIADSTGALYGTTVEGGNSGCGGYGCGVVFELAPDGAETVLHTFAGAPNDGALPISGVIADKQGNLYGTTEEGGASNDGTVFKLAPDGAETTLHSFSGSDGKDPGRGPLLDVGPYLYGTTIAGGGADDGVVFRIRK